MAQETSSPSSLNVSLQGQSYMCTISNVAVSFSGSSSKDVDASLKLPLRAAWKECEAS